MAVTSAMPTTGWKGRLDLAVRHASAEVIGASLITEVQHARLVMVALEAFGDEPPAIFYIEAASESSRIPRPDLIVVHPAIGALVIENKGIALDQIHNVSASVLTLVRDGRLKEEDPLAQAGKVMFELRDLALGRMDAAGALFTHTAAFPLISRKAFASRFGADERWDNAIFAEEVTSPERFRQHVLEMVEREKRRAKRATVLTPHARTTLLSILNGKGFLTNPRRSLISETDANLLGLQVQEMELALKEPTQQQKEIGKKDLRGSHWLFRGVAGSGKSLMLILSAANTLTLYSEEANGLFRTAPRRVLVVCYNRTLVHYLKGRIEERYARVAWDKPSAGALRVTHIEALIRELEGADPSLATGLSYDDRDKRAAALCKKLNELPPEKLASLQFDAIYIDEGQDLEREELRLLLQLSAKDANGGQTFVLFYDNAQNIYGVRPPTWSELGVDIVGRTNFLNICLRNTREVLSVAFNVLVGSFAAEGERAAARGFADFATLRRNNLIGEADGRVEVLFAQRSGPVPYVRKYANRNEEIAGAVEIIRRLLTNHKVIPSDILVLYNSHRSYEDLHRKLRGMLGDKVRFVDREHDSEKNHPLVQEGILTACTIASAKGYDAPVVLLLGVDQLTTSLDDRARFYVGATRAKLDCHGNQSSGNSAVG